ncbi:UNVERIFIED_ORG: AcrR family transcriptional regulator [Microbispora rosea subsp. rosea]
MPRVGLSREKVLAAALALVDREGIAALSMRRLGSELGVEAMTLYYYVPNKDAVLDGLIDMAVSRVTVEPVGPWREWLRAFAVAIRRELLAHPALLPLVATRPVLAPGGPGDRGADGGRPAGRGVRRAGGTPARQRGGHVRRRAHAGRGRTYARA